MRFVVWFCSIMLVFGGALSARADIKPAPNGDLPYPESFKPFFWFSTDTGFAVLNTGYREDAEWRYDLPCSMTALRVQPEYGDTVEIEQLDKGTPCVVYRKIARGDAWTVSFPTPVQGCQDAVYRVHRVPAQPGDANLDGKVTLGDATVMLRRILGLVTFDAELDALCDMNHDGSLSIGDAVLVMRRAIGG